MIQQYAAKTKTLVVSGRSQNGVTQTMVDPNYMDFQEYLDGQLAYIRSQPFDGLSNDNERRGWCDAMKYDGDADTERYLAKPDAEPIQTDW